MKILVIGLEGAAPDIVFQDERLTTLRSLMEAGTYGRLAGVVPAAPVPGWMCLATGRDPGSLGVYGLRNRADRTYDNAASVDSRSFDAPAMWDQVAQAGGRSILIGVPPAYPPRPVAGLSIAGAVPPDEIDGGLTHPPELAEAVERLVGRYPGDVCDLERAGLPGPRDGGILEMSRRQFQVVRHLMAEEPWEYFHFVDNGLDAIQQAFWRECDPEAPGHDPDGPDAGFIRDYYLHLNEELAKVLEVMPEDALILVASVHGARRSAGTFAVNEWLVREGLLKASSPSDLAVGLSRADVDWGATTAWAEGGHRIRIHLNVKGREPEGAVDPADYEAVRDDLKARLEALAGPDGRPMGLRAFRPEEIYREVRGQAPDLIVDPGEAGWASYGGVGCSAIHLRGHDGFIGNWSPGPDGIFVLASSQLPAFGEIEGVRVPDVAPTLLELAGLPPLPDAVGRNFLEGREPTDPAAGPTDLDDDELLRDRLRGLGYIG